jgi:hypothetical protein
MMYVFPNQILDLLVQRLAEGYKFKNLIQTVEVSEFLKSFATQNPASVCDLEFSYNCST